MDRKSNKRNLPHNFADIYYSNFDDDDDTKDLLELDDLDFSEVNGEVLAELEAQAGISLQSQTLDWASRIERLKKTGSAKILTKPLAQRKASIGGKWSSDEDQSLREIVQEHGPKNWKKIANMLGPTRTDVQCLHRWNKVLKPGLHKGSWTDEEDSIVKEMVFLHGVGKVKWSLIAARLPGRIGKQCRERWFNHLDPAIRKGDWTNAEDIVLFQAQKHFGNRWCEISKVLKGRTENAVKNRWNSSTMKKWLKDNNLKAGSGAPIQDFSITGMHLTLISFIEALNVHGVDMTYETAADLLGLGDVMSPEGPLAETESGIGGFLSNDEEDEEECDDDDDDDDDDNNNNNENFITTTHENDSSMDQRQLKKKKIIKNSENNELSTSSIDLHLPFNSSMSGLPSRLRPSTIDTSISSTNSFIMGSTLNHDDSANRLMHMLYELKSNTSSPQEINIHGKGRNENLKNNNNDLKNQLKKNENVDLLWDSSDIHSFKNNSTNIYQKDDRDNSDIYNSSYSKNDFDKLSSSGSNPLDTKEINRQGSPTSRALSRLHIALQQKEQFDVDTGAIEQVPLQMLPYFKFLNENAQRDIMRQLIERFQRTSFTPRNNILPTPKYDSDIMSADFLGSPRLAPVDPYCFEINESDDLLNGLGCHSNMNGGVWGPNYSLMSPLNTTSPLSKNPNYGISNNNTNSNQKSRGKDTNKQMYFSSYDETAIDAAVIIALQVASKSTSAEQLLKVLVASDTTSTSQSTL